jgi:hypothetical protein
VVCVDLGGGWEEEEEQCGVGWEEEEEAELLWCPRHGKKRKEKRVLVLNNKVTG